MAGESITLYKLIILYMLSKVNTPLSQGIISDYIINHGYTNYFNVQNAFADLLEADFIQEDATYHLAFYRITKTGQETLELFQERISPAIRKEIKEYLSQNRIKILNETSYVSDYKLTKNGTYISTCHLCEDNQNIFSLSLETTAEKDAKKICENWENASQELYSMALQLLLKKGM